ncbi:hypothetical protein H4R26_003636 [Coemansia thaxteri]|uniref:VWFA domain-containing protein n=1 Tax=Coemansia thaxteri TaxID=2663907 RepID=A0A9W8BHN2_9FUNG|nr:hypothetical protein H4R26_003636 [Coemansia thaxteri]
MLFVLMIFVFLVDTSVSMEQALSTVPPCVPAKKRDEGLPNEYLFGGEKDRVSRRWQRKGASFNLAASTGKHRTTRLECAKNIVEQIVANRSNHDQDRYMLVTYSGTGNSCICSNLKDSRATLLAELHKLEANDRFSGGMSLTALFNQLSLMRGAYDMDTYGYGRYPALNEPTHIVWLTDGASVVTSHGVQNKLNLPVNTTPWVEAYVEPFRWDQRLILVFLHDQGDSQLCGSRQHSSENTLLPMCKVMGGTIHHAGSMHQAQCFVNSFAPARANGNPNRPPGPAMAAPGVLVNFERIDDNPAALGNSDLRVLLHASPSSITSAPLPPPTDAPASALNSGAQRSPTAGSYGNSAGLTALINGHLGYFPIPEAFWPESITPPRTQGGNLGQGAQQQMPSATGSGWQIQRRSAHPTLGYSTACIEWAVPPQFPFDKYQIDTHCSVAQKLLVAAREAQVAHEAQGNKGPAKPVCWPVFVNGSYTTPKNSGFPFGILRPNTARTAVNLFVLPYNFAALWKILGKLDAQAQSQQSTRSAIALQPAWRREFEEYLQHTPGYYAIPLKRAFNLYGIPHDGVFPKTFGQSTGMRNTTQYSLRLHTISRKEWARMHPGSSADGSNRSGPAARALGLQTALMDFDPASDIGHMVTNAFDVDRAHCLATLSAMRRVFVRECMASPSMYFRANAVVPPSILPAQPPAKGAAGYPDMDVDSDINDQESGSPVYSPYMPPVATMDYSLYGLSQPSDGGTELLSGLAGVGGRAQSSVGARQRGTEPSLSRLGPGMQLSPLGGLVDVASEDDRDTRHSVPIRDMGEYSMTLHRMKAHEARDPLLDERMAILQNRKMFGNPYCRPQREPRGPSNNVLARNPELSAKLGLARPTPRAAAGSAGVSTSNGSNGSGGPPRPDSDDEAGAAVGLEMESEAEINELAMDKMLDDMPMEPGDNALGSDAINGNSGAGGKSGKFWWLQRRNVPRRRSINTPWRKNDTSWNVNPWAQAAPSGSSEADSDGKIGPGALTYTSDALLISRLTGKVVRTANEAGATDGSAAQNLSELLTADSPPPMEPKSDVDIVSPGSEGSANNTQEARQQISEPLIALQEALVPSSLASNVPALDVAGKLSETSVGVENDSNMAVDSVAGDLKAPVATTSDVVNFEATYPHKAEAAATAMTEAGAVHLPAPAPASAVARKVNVAEEKAWFLKRIKADPARYDEEAILQRMTELQTGALPLGKPQLKLVVAAAVAAAKAMRRKQLVARLEESAMAAHL